MSVVLDLTGLGVGTGVAIGPVARLREPDVPSQNRIPDDLASELARAIAALQATATELRRRAVAAGPVGSAILEAQALMADDPAIAAEVERRIHAGLPAETAIETAFDGYRTLLLDAGDYLAARVCDLDDVARRAVAACGGGVGAPELPAPGHPYVLVARDLAPADTALLDLSSVLALVTEEGGPTSHTAILARARGIPAVVGCAGVLGVADGTDVLVDAEQGLVVIEPDRARRSALGLRSSRLSHHPRASGPGRSADGSPIALMANVGGTADLHRARQAGAEGVGLFRTEFLFLHRAEAPSRAEQVVAYRAAFEAFPGQCVVARVLDAGADKPMAFLPHPTEPNPALGVRGLRALRTHDALLDCQLEALAEAARGLDTAVWVMAPMVADVGDAHWFVERARPYGFAATGVMVEVPAAALTADQLLDEVDFVSIGTNDLAQYTLAADRMLGALGSLLDPWHPAVLKLVGLVARAGARAGKRVGVCGEAASDPLLACAMAGVGVTSLSMTPAAIGPVRDVLSTRSLDAFTEFADELVQAGTAAAARHVAARWRGEP